MKNTEAQDAAELARKPLTHEGLFAYFDQMADENGRFNTTAEWLAETVIEFLDRFKGICTLENLRL